MRHDWRQDFLYREEIAYYAFSIRNAGSTPQLVRLFATTAFDDPLPGNVEYNSEVAGAAVAGGSIVYLPSLDRYYVTQNNTAIHVINAATDGVIASPAATVDASHYGFFSPTALYVPDVTTGLQKLDLAANTISFVAGSGEYNSGVYVGATARAYLPLVGSNDLDIFNPSTDSVVGTISGLTYTASGLVYHSGRNLIYSFRLNDPLIYVIDPSSGSVVGTITASFNLSGIVVNEVEDALYISENGGSAQVARILLSTLGQQAITTFSSPSITSLTINPSSGIVSGRSGTEIILIEGINVTSIATLSTATGLAAWDSLRSVWLGPVAAGPNVLKLTLGEKTIVQNGGASLGSVNTEVASCPFLCELMGITASSFPQLNQQLTAIEFEANGNSERTSIQIGAYVTAQDELPKIYLGRKDFGKKNLVFNTNNGLEYWLLPGSSVFLEFYGRQLKTENWLYDNRAQNQ